MKWRNQLLLIVIGLIIVSTILIALPRDPSSDTSQTEGTCIDNPSTTVKPEEGHCAPNFTLPNRDGDQVELHANDGKPTFINFWATWCEPCQSELPYMEEAYKKYQDQVNFLMVNATGTEQNEKNVTQFINQHQYTFPVLFDRRSTDVAFGQYQLVGIPVTMIVDADGKVLLKRVGAISKDEIHQWMKKITRS